MNSPTRVSQFLSIVYVSSATSKLREEDLAALVRQARGYNLSNDVTGVLLHHDGCFMQAIEGPVSVVTALFERIQNDRRHRGLIELNRELVSSREFPLWPMVLAGDARSLGLALETTGPLARNDSPGRRWRDGVATGFLRTFTGPNSYLSRWEPYS